jgi:hypothetical protein
LSTKTLYVFFICSMPATCFTHPTLLDFITLSIFDQV